MVRRAGQAVRSVRWRDPRVQVWGMLGGLLVVGIGVHYVRGRAMGEQKNSATAFGLLCQGTVGQSNSWRPEVAMGPEGLDGEGAESLLAAEPDLRALAEKAAGQSGWRHVSAPMRSKLAATPVPFAKVEVKWSGTSGGNAAALDLYHTKTLGHGDGVPCDFIVGNGNRGVDGFIEATRRWMADGTGPRDGIGICLVGNGPELTSAQEAALGELITCIEARSGHVALAMHRPELPGLLADAGDN